MAQKPRVLVVEDDAEIGGALRRSLRLEGYDVRLAEDGVAALEESALFEPDAVVLDLGLPRLDGVDVCRRLRESSDVPILMLTARDGVDARVTGLDSGADDYLVKPFDREELHARLRALLRRRPPRGSAFLVVGDVSRMRSDFDNNLQISAQQLADRLAWERTLEGWQLATPPQVVGAATAGGTVISFLDLDGKRETTYGPERNPPALGAPSSRIHDV